MTTQHTTPSTPAHAAKPIVIATAIAGGVVLLGIVAAGLYAGLTSQLFRGGESSTTVPATGITEVEVEGGRGTVNVKFADIADPVLEVEGRRDWQMSVDDNELVVSDRTGWFGPIDLCFGTCERDSVTLTLPRSLEGVDTDLSLGSGSLLADGAFGHLSVDVAAGNATVTGSARSVWVELSAGSASVNLADVSEASFEVSAGRGDMVLTGSAPRETDVAVSAGSLIVDLPEASYAVDTEQAAGGFMNQLSVDPASPNRVTAKVSAGSLSLV